MGKCALVVALLVGLGDTAFARDDGRYANDPLRYWFDNLTSSNGNCCAFADGLSISDVDWDTKEVTIACCCTANGSTYRTHQL